MKWIRSAVVSAVLIALMPTGALPAPVLVDYGDVIPFTVEDFESSAPGAFTSPGAFAGFSFSADAPVIADINTLCRFPGQCLTANDLLLDGIRIFSDFEPGTKVFGLQLGFVNPDQFPTLEITVAGRHATRIFSGFTTPDLFARLAFEDLQGLMSVSFRISADIGGPDRSFRTNYSFDNVVTSRRPVTPVPLPAAGWLLFGAIWALGSAGRRAKSRASAPPHPRP